MTKIHFNLQKQRKAAIAEIWFLLQIIKTYQNGCWLIFHPSTPLLWIFNWLNVSTLQSSTVNLLETNYAHKHIHITVKADSDTRKQETNKLNKPPHVAKPLRSLVLQSEEPFKKIYALASRPQGDQQPVAPAMSYVCYCISSKCSLVWK